MDEYQLQGGFYGHFGHGCIHMRVTFDLMSEPGVRKYGEFVERAADLVVSYGGSLSGEHGDGQSRGALLPKMFGPELIEAFRQFKRAWDPGNKMNPHKVVMHIFPRKICGWAPTIIPCSRRRISNFRKTKAPLRNPLWRCIGMGACRKNDSGTMCPSYMVTLEEEHSTRGRAHALLRCCRGKC